MKDTWNGKNNLNFWVGMQAQLNRVEKLLLDYKAREAHKHLDTGRRNSDHLKKEIDEQNELLNRQYAQLTRKQQAMSAQTTDKQQALTTDKQRTPTTGEQPAQPIAPLRQDINQTLARIKSAQIARTITPPRLIAIERERYQLANDDISLQATTLVPIVRLAPPTAQTAPMTPLPPVQPMPTPEAMPLVTPFTEEWTKRTTHAPHITQAAPPLQRLEYRMATDITGKHIQTTLKRRINELIYHFSEVYQRFPDVILMNRDVYDFELAMLRAAVWYDPETDYSIPGFYEFGYPVYDPRLTDLVSGHFKQVYAQYGIEENLDNYTIAACAVRTTNKLPVE
jgi:hypothetical protein